MASGGSSGRLGSGSRSFDFGSDDVLCSYDDMVNQDGANGSRPDLSGKDFRERRIGRPPANIYSQQEGYNKQDVISAVEKCMKKYTDNLLSFLEGISGRLSLLEDYCYNLERSIGDLRSDLSRDQKESDLKLKSLEKHLQEVHRSVQILRDKQELAETQKELSKLQLAQKDSSDRVAPSASEQKKHDDSSDAASQQLALALPQQAVVQVPQPARSLEQNQPYNELPVQQPAPSTFNIQRAPHSLGQGGTFLPQQNQLPSQPLQHQQNTAVQPEPRYAPQRVQTQDLSGQLPRQQPPVLSQSQAPTFPQYQQQWSQQTSQQFPPQVVQQQEGAPQTQFQPQAPVYPLYPPQQPAKAPTEPYSGSAPMPTSYAMIPQSAGIRPEAVPYGYGGQGSIVQQPPTSQPTHSMQHQTPPPTAQGLLGPPQLNSSGYMGAASFSPQSSAHGYMIYGNDGGRTGHPGSYPPGHQNQQPAPGSLVPFHPGTQSMRNHPYGELVEKAVGMGFAREQVVNAIYRMEESSQPIDFNALLDVLNSRPSGPLRGW